MTPALAVLIGAGIVLYAGIHDLSIGDAIQVLLGNASAGDSGGDASSPSGVSGGSGTTMYDGKPVASWIVPVLDWARSHGWHGRVQSGYRTFAQQEAVIPAFGVKAAAGHSEHERTDFPHGAVDVSNFTEFARVLRNYPGGSPLHQLAIDPVHFSGTGH